MTLCFRIAIEVDEVAFIDVILCFRIAMEVDEVALKKDIILE